MLFFRSNKSIFSNISLLGFAVTFSLKGIATVCRFFYDCLPLVHHLPHLVCACARLHDYFSVWRLEWKLVIFALWKSFCGRESGVDHMIWLCHWTSNKVLTWGLTQQVVECLTLNFYSVSSVWDLLWVHLLLSQSCSCMEQDNNAISWVLALTVFSITTHCPKSGSTGLTHFFSHILSRSAI